MAPSFILRPVQVSWELCLACVSNELASRTVNTSMGAINEFTEQCAASPLPHDILGTSTVGDAVGMRVGLGATRMPARPSSSPVLAAVLLQLRRPALQGRERRDTKERRDRQRRKWEEGGGSMGSRTN